VSHYSLSVLFYTDARGAEVGLSNSEARHSDLSTRGSSARAFGGMAGAESRAMCLQALGLLILNTKPKVCRRQVLQ
jgi:hypothetical protein